jgi:hypothetical protein
LIVLIFYYYYQLAPLGVGVIGLSWRAVPCSAANNGTVSEEEKQKLERDVGKLRKKNQVG